MRLIDADTLAEYAKLIGFRDKVLTMIDEAPTVDLVPATICKDAVYKDDVLDVLRKYTKYEKGQMCVAISREVVRLPSATIPVTNKHKKLSGYNWIKEN